jgi:hypothetical protein
MQACAINAESVRSSLATLASAFSRHGENAPPRVQVVAEPGKMRVSERWRWDLNPSAGEISPITDMNPKTSEKSPNWGSHAAMITGAVRLASSGYADAIGVRAAPGGPGSTG